jgi:hypothetical protein
MVDTSMVKQKWKAFAVCQVLANWSNHKDFELYDAMMNCDQDNLVQFFDDNDISIWVPFELWELNDVVDLISDLATSAQCIENQG